MQLFMPEMVDSGKNKELQMAMRKDLRAGAKLLKGKTAWFITAADVPLQDKTKLSLFVMLRTEAESKAWFLKLKGMKPRVLLTGTCTPQTKDGQSVDVALDTVKGDRKAALKTASLAFKLDPKVKVTDAKDAKD